MKVYDFMYEMQQTSAVFGRKKDINVVFEGDEAKTDGETIYLPAMNTEADLTHDQVMTMRGYVDHEAGHIRHSDMKRIIDFYDRNTSNNRDSLSSIHNCLEDVWMENKVAEEYPGAYKNLHHLHQATKKKEYDSWNGTGFEGTLEEVNVNSIGLGIKAHAPQYPVIADSYCEKMKDFLSDNMREWGKMWAQQAFEAKNSEELITLAKSIWKLLEEDPYLSKSSPEDFDPESGNDMDEGEISDEVRRAREASKGGDGQNKPIKIERGEGEGDKLSLTQDQLPDGYMPELGDPAAIVEDADVGVGGIGNPDGPLKSSGYRVYSTSNDRIFERGKTNSKDKHHKVVNSNDHAKYAQVKGGLSATINVMRAKLRRALMAKQRRDWDFGRETGRLDSKRLVGAYNRLPTVYKQRKDREELDTAVTILVDLSGSMGGKKVEVARDCAVAISECLEGSGISFKVVGFCNTRSGKNGFSRYASSSNGKFHRYEALDSVVFKGYNNPLRICQGSVANIPSACGGNNSDYDFIKLELSELKRRPENRKVLFVLSDGHPACHTDASSSELIKHCKTAIKNGRKDGVESVGIGICDSTVKRIYDNNVVVNNVSELGTTVFNKLTEILTR